MALQLSSVDIAYEDIASKFFEHFLYIADAINHYEGSGLWDEEDGFYYDRLRVGDGRHILLRLRSLVGLVPLVRDRYARDTYDRPPSWLQKTHAMVCRPSQRSDRGTRTHYGVRNGRKTVVLCRESSTSGAHSSTRFRRDRIPIAVWYSLTLPVSQRQSLHVGLDGANFSVGYEPGESMTGTFGGNSNWRGPVWFPMNFLIIEALQRLHHYYGDSLTVEFPTGSGHRMNLRQAARQLSRRLSGIFLPDTNGRRPVFGDSTLFQDDSNFRNHMLFHEFFHGDTGKGLGASHQTGWTGLVAKLLQQSGAPEK